MTRPATRFKRLSRFVRRNARANPFAIMLLSLPALCLAKSPPCESWPINVADGQLIRAGLLERENLDWRKTRAVRLSSEKIGKDRLYHKDLYRQVHHVTYYEKSGKPISVITVNDAGWEECSMSQVEVFVVSLHLEPLEPLIKGLGDSPKQ
ncbi:hypothetical protein LJ656_08880 [Paraburkholderia sp. MMS20-SJTR3]|uniref:Uncharacterized protein n=1 Tax=Paraburkholderia sejongensis TaxID=2886946 RepID=A0ABS8JSG9_9BURK|nr:hypothetical protein [Paraburkholderia sp. MMS20-SJTR3]MCC8392700.1 hypothetical protein [Paraburkholderia sp. MMS20-SJTR3]